MARTGEHQGAKHNQIEPAELPFAQVPIGMHQEQGHKQQHDDGYARQTGQPAQVLRRTPKASILSC